MCPGSGGRTGAAGARRKSGGQGCQGSLQTPGRAGRKSRPCAIPGSRPPAPALRRPPARGFLRREQRLRRGAASVEQPGPRPAAPRLTSPRGPGGAGPPLPGPAAAAAARPELRPPRPTPPRGREVGGHRQHQRDAAGGLTRSGATGARPRRSLWRTLQRSREHAQTPEGARDLKPSAPRRAEFG